MAIAFQSVEVANATSGSSVTVNKPVSLAVGDLMIAHVVVRNNPARIITTLSGWTIIETEQQIDSGNVTSTKAMYKIADSSDVAASTFTFAFSGTSNANFGAVYRFTGTSTSTPIDSSDVAGGGSTLTPNYGGDADPSFANSMLVFLISIAANGSNPAVSTTSVAVSVSNPTWTQVYNTRISTTIVNVSGAYALRTQDTAVGDHTAVFSAGGAPTDSTGFLIVIRPTVDSNTSVSAITAAVSQIAPTVQTGATVIASALSARVNLIDPTVQLKREWTAQSKTSTTWTSQQKS